MILYLIRHAIAVEATQFEGDDSQRPLTDKGRQKMRSIARGLRELGVRPDMILTSPYLRSTQTAEILAEKLGLKPEQIVCSEHLAPTGYPDHLVEEIDHNYAELEQVAMIGHEPYLSSLASVLVTGGPSATIVLKKGGTCRLSTEKLRYERCAALEWLLAPSQLAEIGA